MADNPVPKFESAGEALRRIIGRERANTVRLSFTRELGPARIMPLAPGPGEWHSCKGGKGSMTLNVLTEQYRCRAVKDGCGDLIVPGKFGHLSVEGGRLVVAVTDDGRKPFRSAFRKQSVLRELAGKLRVRQAGDFEVIADVLAEDAATVQTCLRLLGVPRRRLMTPEQREANAQRLHAFRFRPAAPVNATSGA